MFARVAFFAVLSLGLALDPIDLFINGAKYEITYPCYRQPALISVSTDGKTLLAFAEGRNISAKDCAPPIHGSGENEIGGLVQRVSTDGGASWGPPRTIFSGNIDFYTLVWDHDTNTTWLMLQRLAQVSIFSSLNCGASWSAPVPLAAVPIKPYKVLSPAVGHGLQLTAELCNVASTIFSHMSTDLMHANAKREREQHKLNNW